MSLFSYWDLPKNKNLNNNAKALRKAGILAEVIFWRTFKDKTKIGWDLDRQVIIGSYIVGFFIAELGLVFEVDGSSHDDKMEYDNVRDSFLKGLGLKVIHVIDKDVLNNLDNLYNFVMHSINEREVELKN